jgi:hypothetical protein
MAVTTNTRKLAALLGASGAGIATDGTLTSTAIGEVIVAGDIAAGAVGSSEIAAGAVGESEMAASLIGVKPHIIPGVLYPSYVASGTSNKLLDGTTAHSGAFGTAQSDGRSYYYTNINGSKPIKDPRIGAHFGSQRHTFTSMQLLEQETATHGKEIYSIDGREWIKYMNHADGFLENGNHGVRLRIKNTTDFIEVTGYLTDINISHYTSSNRKFALTVDGGSEGSNLGETTVATPLASRYVGAGSLVNGGINQTLGIHTVKIRATGSDTYPLIIYGIELIAQDKFTDATCDYNDDPTITHDANTRILAGMTVSGTGIPAGATVASVTSTTVFELSASTTTGSVTNGTLTFAAGNIQIPSQNVVSYGKKFTVAGTPHYDPFNGFTNSTTLHSAVVDTATSLGLSSAPGSSASWAISGSNNIRPYNGGRVVKWVDSSGVIKTSVNMMPANAQNISTTAAAEITTPSATNTYLPAFSNDALDHSLAEVAKTFHIREFGNGGANAGTLGGSYADASMLSGDTDDIGYVMDDGLTSLSADDVVFHDSTTSGFSGFGDGDVFYFTFIGTGFSINQIRSAATPTSNYTIYVDGVAVNSSQVFNGVQTYNIVQNLPYGTHIVKFDHGYSGGQAIPHFEQVTFYQPKMPPIPEDAVVIADYMLMADFVKQTDAEDTQISKGVRSLSGSRDVFYNAASALTNNTQLDVNQKQWGMTGARSPASNTLSAKLPFFGTNVIIKTQSTHLAQTIDFAGSTNVAKTALDNSVGSDNDAFSIDTDATLGLVEVTTNVVTGGYSFSGYYLVSPIHTSSHYQTFETPFLHELVGGDRNMEQTNLVVTPDGKTWDQVTRDTSYIGGLCINAELSGEVTHLTDPIVFDEWRGKVAGRALMNKDFAIAYDRLICLKAGQYELLYYHDHTDHISGNDTAHIYVNADNILWTYIKDDNGFATTMTVCVDLVRRDYIKILGTGNGGAGCNYTIKRI